MLIVRDALSTRGGSELPLTVGEKVFEEGGSGGGENACGEFG